MNTKPRFYLAGKIGKNDWRHEIVPDLRGAIYPDDDQHLLFDIEYTLDCGLFDYGGPFFVSCDHGCFHGGNNHGVGVISNDGGDDPIPANSIAKRRKRVFGINLRRLERATHVFAYLESADCYGTLIELGYAAMRGTPLTVGFSPALPLATRDDLWMAASAADQVLHGSALDCWQEFAREHMWEARQDPTTSYGTATTRHFRRAEADRRAETFDKYVGLVSNVNVDELLGGDE